ncbi:hypothetical protein PYW07_006386 [Mythimna separata]|uniref:Fucosyltransferase n=1 Tax=Mythimna separata TaxID=271217 RepID=A0AAD8DWK1_MYTSE|nr:hypothetical protein PYW07_006386 [Mythimna separata]
MYVALAFYSFHTAYTTVSQTGKFQERFNNLQVIILNDTEDRFEKDLKYILVWVKQNQTKNETLFPYDGQTAFIENNCPEINCYITTNQTILNDDYSNFDAIVFNTSLMAKFDGYHGLPKKRRKRQKYVFYGMQSADDHPICNIHVDNFFNWTWTYKFYSDIFSPYIEVKNLNGKVVAPSRKVQWTTHLNPITKSDVKKVTTKTKAIAWIIDNCSFGLRRLVLLPKLTRALKEFNLTLDVYGCGYKQCPKGGCLKAIEKDYYFYMAVEDGVSEDYVTAEVLKGYQNDAVPVVFGGADYTKFLPDNSYINFQFYTEEKLAALLDYTIRNPSVYLQYFNWKNYYTIEKVEEFRGYCELCKMLNDKKKYQTLTSYKNFRSWWYYGPLREKCLPKGAEMLSEIGQYLKEPLNIRQFKKHQVLNQT